MCDLVNSDFHRHGKDTVKALKLKIMKKSNPGRQLLALTALEMCMKNCGAQFHVMVINKELLHEMCRLAQKGDQSGSADRDVTDKILVLIREWAENLRLPQYQERYQDLRRRGVLFPADASRSASAAGVGADSGNTSGSSAAPMYVPRRTNAEAIAANLDAMDPADAAAIRAAVAEAEAEAEAEEAAMAELANRRRSGSHGSGGGGAGRRRVIRRDDGMIINDVGGGGYDAASPPRGYGRLDDDDSFGNSRDGNGRQGSGGGDHGHAAEMLAAQRLSAEEAAMRARGGGRSASVDVSSPEAVAKLKSDLEVARNSVGVLRDMLAGIDPGANPEAARDDVVEQLAEQCRQMRPRVVSLVQSAENEELLMLALELNDELGDALDRADAAVAAAADPDALVAYRAAYGDAGVDDATRETTPPVGDLVDLLGEASVSTPPPGNRNPPGAASGFEPSPGGRPVADPFASSNAPLPVSPPQTHPERAVPHASPPYGSVPPLEAPPGSSSKQHRGPGGPLSSSAAALPAVTLDDLLGPSPAPMAAGAGSSAVADPFADPFTATSSRSSAALPAATPPSATNPFAAPAASAAAVYDPFASGGAAAATNPFAAPSAGGAGFGSMPPASPPTGAGYGYGGAQSQAQAQSPGGGFGFGSPPGSGSGARAMASPAAGTMSTNPLFDRSAGAGDAARDPFADLAALSPPRNGNGNGNGAGGSNNPFAAR